MTKYIESRKDSVLRCGEKDNAFLIKDIYEEIFKRTINPIYTINLFLIISLIILKSKIKNFQNYFKIILFSLGFSLIVFSELSYKLLYLPSLFEVLSILLLILFIISFYFFIIIKSKFRLDYL